MVMRTSVRQVANKLRRVDDMSFATLPVPILSILSYGTACKEKWKNLRSAYARHLRQKNPSGAASVKKKQYYLAEYLDFLLPFTKSRTQHSNIPLPETTSADNLSKSDEHYEAVDSVHSVRKSNIGDTNIVEEDQVNEQPTLPVQPMKRPKGANKKIDSLENIAMEYFASKTKNI
ncbi:hypothetical protein FQR65_LT00020 [Abscondita terminalis]|nr:hypothetical protein FQR65_LT00020 [Abscondita terminalis]